MFSWLYITIQFVLSMTEKTQSILHERPTKECFYRTKNVKSSFWDKGINLLQRIVKLIVHCLILSEFNIVKDNCKQNEDNLNSMFLTHWMISRTLDFNLWKRELVKHTELFNKHNTNQFRSVNHFES